MKRRTAIVKSGWILKSALLGPGMVTAMHACVSKAGSHDQHLVLTNEQLDLVRAICDTIIPRSKSPSASEVQVPEIMDLLLHDVFSEETKSGFKEGLSDFNQVCEETKGSNFLALSPAQRNAYLSEIDWEVMGKDYDQQVPFYYTLKTWCIRIYFLTEQGIKQNLNYQPIPGGFTGDLKMDQNQKIEVGNEM